ncbi:hypothetical protein EUGRSUZ_F01286 [Eucalyptus grandis]|uniref:Uncharacterized protein n=2 Tax=Eucalyptus grandis TaxID=71139 RepID=A0ACC3KEF2_EUCGR|nr:hypothetical protein EUGRSUZ_F01286 [Eucalyptus grandis]
MAISASSSNGHGWLKLEQIVAMAMSPPQALLWFAPERGVPEWFSYRNVGHFMGVDIPSNDHESSMGHWISPTPGYQFYTSAHQLGPAFFC